ncbi:hypothetical protein MXB_1158 [Myxobolus squamalis]|nr:hypothetical protein MXB_1158 [Myxobolus squamalis]
MEKSPLNVKYILFSNIQLAIEDKATFCFLHYIIHKIYPKLSKNTFLGCWPISEKSQETEFKRAINPLLEKLPSV